MKTTGSVEGGEAGSANATPRQGMKLSRVMAILDLVLRVFAAICASGSAVAMGTTRQKVLFSFQLVFFRLKYNDFPTFKFFVIANSVVCAYLVLSIPLSIFHIIRSASKFSRITLIIFDTVMLVLLTSGASTATSTVYLARRGNSSATWLPICRRFSHFCSQVSGSLVGSFFSIIILILTIILSSLSGM